eukprot:COSAG02_NODE_12198_length_1582_cov_1.146325_1_plen_50_part_10
MYLDGQASSRLPALNFRGVVVAISELRAFLAPSAFPRTFVLDGAHRWWLR